MKGTKLKVVKQIYLLMMLGPGVSFSPQSHAQCGVTMSCGDIKKPPSVREICSVHLCFKSDKEQKSFEEANNCIAQNKCAYAVSRVKDVFKEIPKTDPTYGFYRNQDCIADKSCSNKSKLDSAEWLDKVVYDFIMPLVNEGGNWKSIKALCKTYVVLKGLQCQQTMADYHISIDLQESLNSNGCGTQKDWDLVGEWLKSCIEKGIKDDGIPYPFNSAGEKYAFYTVKSERSRVREACVKYRGSKNLLVED